VKDPKGSYSRIAPIGFPRAPPPQQLLRSPSGTLQSESVFEAAVNVGEIFRQQTNALISYGLVREREERTPVELPWQPAQKVVENLLPAIFGERFDRRIES